MPLVQCPECKTEIPDNAETCPKCGYPMRFSFTAFSAGRRSRKVSLSIALLFFSLAILAGGVFMVGTRNSGSSKPAHIQNQEKSQTLLDEKLPVAGKHPTEIAFQLIRPSDIQVELSVMEEGKKGTPLKIDLIDEESYKNYRVCDCDKVTSVKNYPVDKTTGFQSRSRLEPGIYHFLLTSKVYKGFESPKSTARLKLTTLD